MGGVLLPPTGWDPAHPHYSQSIDPRAKDQFAAAFVELAKEGETMMDFGGAINAVKAGHKVYREQWAPHEPGKHIKLNGIDSVVLVDEKGGHSTYTAGPDDQLAEDWRFLNLPDTGDAQAGDPLAQRTYSGQEGPTIPQENIENDNVEFVDTASSGVVPVAPTEDGHVVAGVHIPSVAGERRPRAAEDDPADGA